MNDLKYAFYVFLGGCSFGVLSTFVKLGYDYGFSTNQVVGMQFIIGFLMFAGLILFRKKHTIPTLTFAKLCASGIPMALTGVFYYNSLEYLDASIAIILLFQYTWMGLIVDLIVDKKVPSKTQFVSVALLFIGSLGAVNIFDTSLTSIPIEGLGWGMLAAISFTLFIFVSGRVAAHVPALEKSMIMSIGALIVIILIYPPTYLLTGDYEPSLWILGLILGLFGVVLPPLLFSFSMPKVGNGLGTILSSSELPMAVLMSVIVLHENVTWIQFLGVTIIIIGIIWANLPQIRKYRLAKRI